MTVENTQNKMPPLQMGTASEYPFTFAVLLQDPTEEEALEAIKASVLQADGTEIELEYGTDYTVTLNTDRIGGTLTVNNIRTASDYLTIYRQYEQTQEVDYKDFNSAPAETFEQCFDKLTMLSQQQQEEINRSLKLNVSSTITNPSLPEPIANNTLIWDSEGTGLDNYDIIGENNQFKAEVNSAIATGQAEIQAQFDTLEAQVNTDLTDGLQNIQTQLDTFEEETNANIQEFEDGIDDKIAAVAEAADKINQLEESVEIATTAATSATTAATSALNSANTASQLVEDAQETLSTRADIDLSNLSTTGQEKFDEKVDVDDMVEINLGNSFELFDTKLTDHVLNYQETKGWALQGTYVYKEALAGTRYGYPDFYAKCLQEYNEATTTETVNGVTVKVHSNGHKFYDIANKTAIDEFFNTMGSAWFYGVDTTNERVFLPRNNYFDQYTSVSSEVGDSVEAGLPSIEHTHKFMLMVNPGASNFAPSHYDSAAYSGDYTTTINSDVSSIYGNSDTVQPNAVKKLLYICVGNTTNYEGLSDVVNQGMEILEQVNQGIETRVAKEDMAEVPCIVETYVNGTSWYRVYSDKWGEQGGSVTSSADVTFLKSFSNANYTINGTLTSGSTDYYQPVIITNRTATGCTINNAYSRTVSWYACGYIA